jgi:hypothetical protein
MPLRYGFHHGTRRHDPRRGISPQRNEQFACERHNADPSRPFPGPEVRSKPLGQRALRLPVHPAPRQLDTHRLQPRIARATDPLIPRTLATVIFDRRKPDEPANLPTILKRAPH